MHQMLHPKDLPPKELPLKELPGAAYVDPAYARAEADRVFARNWVNAASGWQLPEPGDVLPVTVAGKPILLVRQRDRSIRGFHNACRHRGVLLVEKAERGRPVLSCPFHAWGYGLDGSLKRTPHWTVDDGTAPEGFDPARYGLLPVATAFWCDQVFVRVAPTGPSFEEHIAPVARRWAAYDLSLLRYGAHATYEVSANWKLAVQNFLDTYHLPFVHPELGDLAQAKHYVEVDEEATLIGINYLTGAVAKDKGTGAMPSFPGLSPAQRTGQDIVMLYPNTLVELVPDHMILFRLDPLAADRTGETISFYFVGAGASDPAFAAARDGLVRVWDKLNHQDFAILRRWQAAQVSPGAADQPEISPFWEKSGAVFRARIAREMADAGQNAGPGEGA